MEWTLVFKWTVSKAWGTNGWNVCSLYVDRKKVSSCNGGGYDMQATALGSWAERRFREELLKLKEPFHGLTFHDPNFDPGKEMIDGQTIEEREKAGLTIGLDRYQAYYEASSKVPTDRHIITEIDGACGMESVKSIIEALGYELIFIDETSNRTVYQMRKKETRREAA